MNEKEYQLLLYQAAIVSKMLTELLNEDGQELFEAYGLLYEQIVRYEASCKA